MGWEKVKVKVQVILWTRLKDRRETTWYMAIAPTHCELPLWAKLSLNAWHTVWHLTIRTAYDNKYCPMPQWWRRSLRHSLLTTWAFHGGDWPLTPGDVLFPRGSVYHPWAQLNCLSCLNEDEQDRKSPHLYLLWLLHLHPIPRLAILPRGRGHSEHPKQISTLSLLTTG